MYPSGRWEGFWVQESLGRQAMRRLYLHFAAGRVTGEGQDVVGRFLFTGRYDEPTGEVRLVKQYIGRHQVLYVGRPDGEGSLQGTWSIGPDWTGPFLLRPVLPRPTGRTQPISWIGSAPVGLSRLSPPAQSKGCG